MELSLSRFQLRSNRCIMDGNIPNCGKCGSYHIYLINFRSSDIEKDKDVEKIEMLKNYS